MKACCKSLFSALLSLLLGPAWLASGQALLIDDMFTYPVGMLEANVGGRGTASTRRAAWLMS